MSRKALSKGGGGVVLESIEKRRDIVGSDCVVSGEIRGCGFP